jgi:hypothetical protein
MRALTLALLLWSIQAHADPPPSRRAVAEARQAFTRGVEQMRRSRWAEALDDLRRSIELHPTRVARFNAAMCLKNLGRLDEALAMLEGLMAGSEGDTGPARVAIVRVEIEALRALMGQLVVTVDVEGAEVSVDDRVVGQAPLARPIYVLAGNHSVQARRTGGGTVEEQVQVQAGEVRAVRLVLQPRPVQRGPGRARTTARSGPPPALFWGSLIVAGAATVTTTVLGSIALVGSADYEADPDRTEEDQRAGQRLVLLTDVSLSVAVVTAGAAFVLWLLTDFSPPGAEEHL